MTAARVAAAAEMASAAATVAAAAWVREHRRRGHQSAQDSNRQS
jgi:hypothetical protein